LPSQPLPHDIAGRVEIFIRTVIIPYETDRRWGPHGPSEELVSELRDRARNASLMTPHILPDGSHLSHRETAIVLRAAGHAHGTVESSMAKVAVSEALYRVADRSVQVMGGTGVTRDTIVEQVFREMRAFRIYDGPTEVHKWSIAKRIKKNYTAIDSA
jgi:alkylation response protein AidB-like acyl-CoA dehydrogenase